jgi:septum site-determining protein MinC
MSDFSNRRNEAGQSSDSRERDVMENEKHTLSPASVNGNSGDDFSMQSDEKNPMLTKVADLLDDITEMDQETTPSLNEKWDSSFGDQKEPAVPERRDLGKVEVSTSRGESGPINANQIDHNTGDDETPEADNDDEITIKGRGDGVAIELGIGDWSHLVANLDGRLEQAAGFFRGGKVSLDTGSRPLIEPELDQVCAIFHKYSLSVGMIRTGSERTFQSAMTLGLACTLDNPDTEVQNEAVCADSNQEEQSYFVYRGNLRSGHVLRRQESVVIIGDVNPGGHVVSSGDIIIWGRLRGVAHAGAEGDVNVIVSALMLEPTQIRIANIVAVGPGQSNGRPREKRKADDPIVPQVAFVDEDKLVIRPWQHARRGFRSVLLGI